jgi:hypothetical protein
MARHHSTVARARATLGELETAARLIFAPGSHAQAIRRGAGRTCRQT